jgi:hypothetical protein
MFAHAGTSGGATQQGAYYARVRGQLIFDVLGDNPWLWRVYYHDAPHLWLTGDFWTRTFARQLRRVHRFRQDVHNDELPVYMFIEPRHIVAPWNSHRQANVNGAIALPLGALDNECSCFVGNLPSLPLGPEVRHHSAGRPKVVELESVVKLVETGDRIRAVLFLLESRARFELLRVLVRQGGSREPVRQSEVRVRLALSPLHFGTLLPPI